MSQPGIALHPARRAAQVVMQLCDRAFASPMTTVVVMDEAAARISRLKLAASVWHQLELRTRQLVADKVAQAKARCVMS